MAIAISIVVLLLLAGAGVGVWYFIKNKQKIADKIEPGITIPTTPDISIETKKEEEVKPPLDYSVEDIPNVENILKEDEVVNIEDTKIDVPKVEEELSNKELLPSEGTQEEITKKEEKEIEVKNIAIKRRAGTNFSNYESLAEIEIRLNSMPREAFEALNIDDRPWTMEQWLDPALSDEDKVKRNMYEISMLFRYDASGAEVAEHARILTKKYKIQ